MADLSPIESEFASTEEADAYDRWLRAKVKAALVSNKPAVTHDAAMAEARLMIEHGEHVAPDLAR